MNERNAYFHFFLFSEKFGLFCFFFTFDIWAFWQPGNMENKPNLLTSVTRFHASHFLMLMLMLRSGAAKTKLNVNEPTS